MQQSKTSIILKYFEPTIGLFNYADAQVAAGAAHAGWNLKTTGSGGRANRVTHETLVCLTNAA